MTTPAQPMRDVRSTLILCDQLYPSMNGKWVIAGTYTQWHAPAGAAQFQLPPLNIYIRFQVEQAGDYACDLLLVHRSMPSSAEVILRQQVKLGITDPLAPCELGCVLPPFVVHCPQIQNRQADESIGVPLLLWLRVGGCDIASCPLNVIFPPALGVDHAADPRPDPEADQR